MKPLLKFEGPVLKPPILSQVDKDFLDAGYIQIIPTFIVSVFYLSQFQITSSYQSKVTYCPVMRITGIANKLQDSYLS